MNATLFVVPVISVWPEVLMKDPSDQPDKVVSHGMILVLEEVLTKSLLTQESEANKKVSYQYKLYILHYKYEAFLIMVNLYLNN